MTVRRLRRLALVAVLALGAAALTSCSSTMRDAATVTYTDESGTHTVHISPDDVLDFVKQVTSNEELRRRYLDSFKYGDNVNTTDASFTAAYLTQLVNQVAYDAEFNERKLEIDEATRQRAEAVWKQRLSTDAEINNATSFETLQSKVFDELPAGMRDDLVEAQARSDAVRSTCPSDRLISDIVFDTREHAQAAFDRIRSGPNFETVAQEILQDPAAGVVNAARGCFFPGFGDPAPQYQEAASTNPLGMLTVPLETERGFHLLLAEQWDQSMLQDQNIAQAVQQFNDEQVGDRLSNMRVYINPKYGTWDPATGSVLPPEVPNPATNREGRPVTTTTLFDPTQLGG